MSPNESSNPIKDHDGQDISLPSDFRKSSQPKANANETDKGQQTSLPNEDLHSFNLIQKNKDSNDFIKPEKDKKNAFQEKVKKNPLNVEKSISNNEAEGGEWDILTNKLIGWWNKYQLPNNWNQLGRTFILFLSLLLLLILLKTYSSILNTINNIPLASSLLELIGFAYLVKFTIQRLIKEESRKELLKNLVNKFDLLKFTSNIDQEI